MAPIDVAAVRFTPVRKGLGYDMGYVDDLLARIEQSLAWLNESVAGLRRHNDRLAAATPAEPPADAVSRAVLGPDPDPVSKQGLTEVHRRETYNAAEVDAFLLEVEAEEARLRTELAAERQRNTALIDALPADARPVYTAAPVARSRAEHWAESPEAFALLSRWGGFRERGWMSSYDREQVSAWYDVVEQYFSEAIGRLQVLIEHNDLLASGQHVAPTASTLLSLAVHGPDPVLPDPGLTRGRLREGFATEEVDAFNADARAFLEGLQQQLEDQRRRLGVLLDGLAPASRPTYPTPPAPDLPAVRRAPGPVTRVVDAIFFLLEQALFAFKALGAVLALMILVYALVSVLR